MTPVSVGIIGRTAWYADATLGNNNAGYHNSVFRGKNLGTSYTAAQKSQITGGTFNDIFVGDYWVINNKTWRIWGLDWYLRNGNTETTAHHAVILPDTCLLAGDGSTTHYMNDTDTTTGGYKSTKMRETYLPQCLTMVEAAFGASNILAHREYITNAVSNGKASGCEWLETKIEVPNEVMMYGSVAWGEADYNSGRNVGTLKTRLPLARLAPHLISNRQTFWLRDVVSASTFAIVAAYGIAGYFGASYANPGVRPFFLLS